jgi:hypothetical protein
MNDTTTNVEECGPCPVFASNTMAFALQLRRKQKKTCQGKKNPSQVKKNLSQSRVYIYQHTHTYTHTHTHTHITKQYKTTTVQIKTKCIRKSNNARKNNT